MATFDSIFYPTGEEATGTVNAGASSAEIPIGPNRVFAFICSGDCNVKFGATGVTAATGSNFKLPAGTIARYDTGSHVQSFRIFNPTGVTITYWIQYLAR